MNKLMLLVLGVIAFGCVVDVLLGKILPRWMSFPIAFGAACVLGIWVGYGVVLTS